MYDNIKTILEKIDLLEIKKKAQNTAKKIPLPIQNKNIRGKIGDFSSSNSGNSIDFKDQRNYILGDDPRNINWQTYARTEKYIMKVFQDEIKPETELIFDASPSMFLNEKKAKISLELFFYCTFSALNLSLNPNIFISNQKNYKYSIKEFLKIDLIKKILDLNNINKISSSSPPNIKNTAKYKSKIIVSDLLFAQDSKLFIQNIKKKSIIFAPFSPVEKNPNWQNGNIDFIDSENSTTNSRFINSKIIQQYKKIYNTHFKLWHKNCSAKSITVKKINSDQDLISSLHKAF